MFDKFRKLILGVAGVVSVAAIGLFVSQEMPKVVPTAEQESKPDYFNEALAVVMKHEGYFSDDPDDKGGKTKWGISMRFLKAENIDVDHDGDIDDDDLKKLTKTDADNIYLHKFWDRNGYGKIDDKKVAIKLFDISVNTGATRAHKILKKALNDVIYEPILVDGKLDDDTIKIVNLIEPSLLMDALRMEQANFYNAIIKKTPEYSKYRNGWLARAAW